MKLVKFTISPSGQLVYKSTGKLAPADYTFRKNTVYGPNGRRVGSLSRKLTKAEATKIAKAEKSRTARQRRAAAKAKGGRQDRPKQGKPKAPSKTGTQRYGDDWERFGQTDFPEPDVWVKEEFAQRVRDAASSVAPAWLQSRIQAFSTEALWQAYSEDAYIFEVYFKYHVAGNPPRKSDVSVWLYQFVTRIEQYMGVKV